MAGFPVRNDRIARFLELTAPDRARATLDEVFQRMLGGGGGEAGRCESYISVCRDLGIPSGKFLLWVKSDIARYREFNEALETQARLGALEVVEIADEEPRVKENGDIDAGDIAWKKLKMDGRKWIAPFHAKEYVETKQLDVNVTHDLASRLYAARERLAQRPPLEGVVERVVSDTDTTDSEATFL